MGPFLIIFIVLIIINIFFLALAFVHTYIYGKSKPEDMMSPRMSAASAMLNRQLNPRLSLQPQVTLFDLIRTSAGSSAYDSQMEGKRMSVQHGPRESMTRSVTQEG